jgi:hypothetical protein
MAMTSTTIDRPPVAAEITADVLLGIAEMFAITPTRRVYLRVLPGRGLCGCAVGLAAVARVPSLARETTEVGLECQDIWYYAGYYNNAMFMWGMERGFEGHCLPPDVSDPDASRGYAVGREVARRAGLGD